MRLSAAPNSLPRLHDDTPTIPKLLNSPFWQVGIDEYPLADRVTWRYFQGRVAMLDGQHDKAEAELSFAFYNTPPAHSHNRRVILCCLIPVRLMLYQNKPSQTRQAATPSDELLTKYRPPPSALLPHPLATRPSLVPHDRACALRTAPHFCHFRPFRRYKLPEFQALVSAFKTGNVVQFDQALEDNMDFFVARSIYLLMHRLKLFVYRNLFKRAYLVEGKTQIKIDVFVCAVRACGCEDVEPEQVLSPLPPSPLHGSALPQVTMARLTQHPLCS